jgi:hypothetical protein
MILCGMLDLCRLIVALVIDLFRPRAAVEAEILVLRNGAVQNLLAPRYMVPTMQILAISMTF